MGIADDLELSETASGHVRLVLRYPTFWSGIYLRLLLQLRHGFRRGGHRILGMGEAIFPDFVRGNLRLFADFDDLVGLNLYSESPEGDAFLRRLAGRHVQRGARHAGWHSSRSDGSPWPQVIFRFALKG